MKYSFPGRFYLIPAAGSEPRASRAGNDSLLAAFDGGGGGVRIRAADHQNQAPFLLFEQVTASSGAPGSP